MRYLIEIRIDFQRINWIYERTKFKVTKYLKSRICFLIGHSYEVTKVYDFSGENYALKRKCKYCKEVNYSNQAYEN